MKQQGRQQSGNGRKGRKNKKLMANEIKFIFSGDTAAFDKAIDSVVKKTNKAKASTEKITEAQKTQVKLQKLLNEEYSRQGAKTTGSILTIQDKIKRTEKDRVKISKRLNDASLTREKRLKTIVELSKTEAHLAGLTAARRTKMLGAAGRVGGSVLARMGLGAVASAGGALAGAGGAAALFGPLGMAIAAIVVAITAAVVALKVFKAVVRGTSSAMAQSRGLQNTARMAGKTVEQVQAEQMAGLFGGNASSDMGLFKQLGLIIDKEIIQSLARSGKVFIAFGIQISNVLIPLFERLAKATSGLVKIMGGSVLALKATFGPVLSFIADNPFVSMTPPGMLFALAQANPSAGGKAFEDYFNSINELIRGTIEGTTGSGAGPKIAMQTASDALTRIGLFKGGADSQIQTLKANLAATRAIQGNTDNLIPTIENA